MKKRALISLSIAIVMTIIQLLFDRLYIHYPIYVGGYYFNLVIIITGIISSLIAYYILYNKIIKVRYEEDIKGVLINSIIASIIYALFMMVYIYFFWGYYYPGTLLFSIVVSEFIMSTIGCSIGSFVIYKYWSKKPSEILFPKGLEEAIPTTEITLEYCPKCGTKLDANYIVCPVCGFDIKQITEQSYDTRKRELVVEQKSTGTGKIIAGIIFLILFFITLTMDFIPVIWTGAGLIGIINLLSGIYDYLTQEK